MIVPISLAVIREHGAERPGYIEAVLALAKNVNGDRAEIELEDLNRATAEHPAAGSIRGLGDVVEKIAHPIAKALHLPCVDPVKGLRPDSPCAKRRDWLNKQFPLSH